MKKLILSFIAIGLTTSAAFAQLSGPKTVPGDYPTIFAAVTDLNAQGVGAGGVTFNVAAGYTETLASRINLTATGTVANPIIFQKSGAGANPLITAYVGTSTPGSAAPDGMWSLVGSDFVTIDGIDLVDLNGTNNATMEYGYGLFKASATDGAQNNTIKNCTITLNRVNNASGTAPMVDGSVGIAVMNSTPTAATTVLTITNAAGSNSNNKFYTNIVQNCNIGVALIGFADVSPFTFADTNNDVGGASAGTGNQILNFGGGAAANPAAGIRTLAQYGENISFNTINSNNGAGVNHATTLRGIFNNTAVSASASITNNTITVKSGATTSQLTAIENAAGATAAGNTISINANTITGCTYTTATTGAFTGITTTASAATVNINNNVISSNSTAATSGTTNLIQNTGAATVAININGNNVNGMTYSAATSGAVNAITNSGGAATAVLSMSTNNVQGIVHSVAGSSAHTYIINSAATLSQNISTNTFTNLNVNTTGSVTFISNNVQLPTGGSVTTNTNSIVTAFNKGGAGGTVTLYLTTTTPSSPIGSTKSEQSNNFSNITLTGATTMAGWIDVEGATGGGPTKTISGNTFSNWACGSSAVTVIQTNFSGNNTAVSSNTISGISGTGAITAISIGTSNGGAAESVNSNNISSLTSSGTGGTVLGITGGSTSITTYTVSGNAVSSLASSGASSTVAGLQITAGATVNANGNTINTLSGSGATSPVLTGLSVSSGTTVNVFKNKIYDLAESGAITTTSPAVTGILMSGGTTVNTFNNLVGDLRTPAAGLTDAIRGMSVTSSTATTTYNLSFNTIYLNAASTGTNFGTTGIFHTTSATATTATLNARDNVIVNTSTPNGTGLTVAYRRSSTTLTNYGAASNNNDFYAGTPGASRLIFSDGTNSDQLLSTYKTRVASRDSASATENPPFLSTAGSNANFLHIDTTIATQLESGGTPVTGITDDFDGNARNGTTPDIGADEFNGIALDLTPPNISYTALGNQLVSTTRSFTNVAVTDASGVNTTAGTRPRVYYKKSTDTNDNTGWKFVEASGGGGSPFSFTIDYTQLNAGSVSAGDTIQYFVVAQDVAGTPNVGINSGTFAATPSSVALTAGAFPIGGSINSYAIVNPLSGTKTVGAVGRDYVDLTDVVNGPNGINNTILTGPVTFLLEDAGFTNLPTAPEVFPLVINANPGSSGTNTITIKPDAGVVTSITGSAAGALITVKASFVTIDGSNSGGTDRSLTITNNSAATPSVIVFGSTGTTPVTDDTLKNCVIINGVNTSSAVLVSDATTPGSAGFFNNITLQNNNVQKAFRGILAVATVSGTNGSGTLITQNVMNTAGANSIRLNPIAVQGTNGVTITNNNMGNISDANAEIPLGILLATGVDNAVVTGNTISSIVTTNTTSTASVEGILVSVGAASTSINVSNNTISTLTSSGTAAGNFYALGSFSPNCTISNNNISGLTNSASSVTMWGMALAGASNSTVSGNTVSNMSSTATTGGTPLGINLQGAIANCNVTGNTVSNITTLGSSTTPTGILLSGTLDGITVQNNNVNGVINNNTGTWGAWGMRLNGGNNHVVKNNFVSNITQNMTGGGAFSTSFGIFGIQIDTGTGHKIYDNSVNLSGLMPGTAASSLLTSAFSIVSTSSTGCDVRDNIFANNITGGTTSIAHVSAYLPSGGTSAMTLTWNNNAYYFGTDAARQGTGQAGTTAGTNFFTTLPALKAYSSTLSTLGTNDNASIGLTSAVPFVTSTNLHLATSPIPPVSGAGVTIAGITTDIDGDLRQSPPDIGADEITTYTLTYTAGANGSITGTSPQSVLAGGSGTAVTAVPNTGYHFVNWSDSSTQNPRTDTNVMADISVTANFAINTYNVTYDGNTNTGGTAPVDANNPYNYGSTVTVLGPGSLTKTGYTFSGWNTAANGSGIAYNPADTFIITADTTLFAQWTINTYTLTYMAGANGSISGTSPQTVPYGGSGTAVTAVPDTGYHFVNWSDSSTQNPRTDTNVTGNITVTANFAINTYTLTYTAGANGSITGTSPQTVNYGGSGSAVTAVPDTGYHFVNWSDSSTQNPRTDTNVTADISVMANFAINTYTVTYDGNTNTGGTAPVDANSPYNYNSAVTVLSAGTLTKTGFTFSGWNTAANGSGTSYAPGATFTITADTTLFAVWKSSNADLSNLTATAGALTPAFDPNTLSYTINAPFSTSSTTVTPTAADANATITVNGNAVASGSPSGSISLNVGSNTITIVVSAQDETGIRAVTTVKTYTIDVIRGGNVVISGSTGADGQYATVKDAFDALNANGTQAGNTISVSIIGDTTEAATAALNQPAVSTWTSLTVTPSGARTVTGSLAAPLIDLAGADKVTINGLNASGNSLTISNTSTSATASTIRFINGATNDTVTNCSVLGSSTGTVAAASGTILFSTSTDPLGNSTNMISNNAIGPAGANLPTKGVMGLGTAGNPNASNVIDNNNIFDFFNPTVSVSGISVQANNTLWTISNNRFYQTGARVFTGAVVRYAGITLNYLDTTSVVGGVFTVTGNTIGFGAANGTGTTTISGAGNEFRGIDAENVDVTSATSVQGNTISGISQTTSRNATLTSFATASAAGFIGMQLGGGSGFGAGFFNVGDVTANKIGSLDASSSIVINASSTTNNTLRETGILDISQSDDVISNNQMGTITINSGGTGTRAGFEGIQIISFPGQNVTVTNNIIGGTAAGSITDNIVGQYLMQGIAQPFIFTGGSGNIICTGNLIRNMVSNSNVAGQITMRGIVLAGSVTPGVNTVSQNTIHSLTNIVTGGGLTAIYVMDLSFPDTANVVERNFIHSCSITTTATTSQVRGILVRGTVSPAAASRATYKNNMIRLGLDATGASITTPYEIIGIVDSVNTAGQTSDYYFNSVYIGGSGVASPGSNTFAFVSSSTTTTRNFKDNIFWNARSNAVAGGTAHYAISIAGTAPNPAGTNSNFNDLFASGTDGNVGRYNSLSQLTLANWQAATGQDANSISANPQFVNPTGTAANVDLHITCASPADGAATPIAGITNDFDNETRNATNPDMGADEINLTAPTPVSAVSRLVHPGVGPEDVDLPFAGPAGIEPRSGGVNGDYHVVFTFASNVTVSNAVVTAGTGMVVGVTGSGTNTITVDVTGVTNIQYLTVKLLCVFDGVNLGSVSATMGVLLGDSNGDGSVNSGDIGLVKSQSGNPVTNTNFREDVNVDGLLNSGDVGQTKAQSGTALP